jgi:hypothetical protein
MLIIAMDFGNFCCLIKEKPLNLQENVVACFGLIDLVFCVFCLIVVVGVLCAQVRW